MNHEDIIKLAREAGFEQNSLGMTYTSGALPDLLERFASLVAAAEREECAKLCENLANAVSNENHIAIEQRQFCAKAIRARGMK